MDDEQPRTDANSNERAFVLTIQDAAQLYAAAGHARTLRAIQKYCERGDLEAKKEDTAYGQRYRITRESVARHVEQIEQLSQTHRREPTRTDAAVRTAEDQHDEVRTDGTNVREQSRTDAADDRYVTKLEDDIIFLRAQITKKDVQIDRRDTQIEAMLERDRETNVLIQQLQERLPLLGRSERRGDVGVIPHTDIIGEQAIGG